MGRGSKAACKPGQGGPFVPEDRGGSLFLSELSLHPCSLPSEDWILIALHTRSQGLQSLPSDTGATAPLLGNPTVSISLWTSKQGDLKSNACPSTVTAALLCHIQGWSYRQRAAMHSPSGLTGWLSRPSSFSSSRARVTLCSYDDKSN